MFASEKKDLKEVAEKYVLQKDSLASIAVFGSQPTERITNDSSWEFHQLAMEGGPTTTEEAEGGQQQ